MNKIMKTKKGDYVAFGAKRIIERMFGKTDSSLIGFDIVEDDEKKQVNLQFTKK
jgi:hypothetical protein